MKKILLSSLTCLGLGAQEPPPMELPDLQQALDQPIAAASKRLQRLKEAPADATVLTAVELGDLGYRTLGEALEGVLGFRVNNDRAYQGLGVRGLYILGDQNTRVLILLDGHALNSPAEVGSGKVGEDFGIPLDQIERIEIIRGPASSLYGNNAFLGMVNVVTKGMADSTVQGNATATANTRSLSGLDAALGGPLGSARWQVLCSGMQRKGSETQFDAPGFGALPADLDREERQSAYLQARGRDWSAAGYAMSRTQFLPSAPFLTAIGSPLNQYRNRILFGDVRYEPKLGEVETLFRIFGDRNDYSNVLDYRNGRDPQTIGIYQEANPDRDMGLEAQARFHAGASLLFTIGTEYSWHRYDGLAGLAPDFIETRVRHEVGNSYLQADWTPTDAITCVLGLQGSQWKVASAQNVTNGVVSGMDHRSLTGVTPRFAFIALPTAVDIVKVLYGGGFRNPTVFERYYDDGSSIRANPGLDPERIQTLQGIWVRIWEWGIQTQLSYSESRWRNLIQAEDLGGGFQQSRNDDQSIHGRGLEGELKGRWSDWEAYAQAGAYRWERAGSPLPNAASFQGALRATRRWNAWSASAEVRQVGRRVNPQTSTVAPAATTLRLALRWDGQRAWVRAVAEDAGQARRIDLVAQDYEPISAMRADGSTLSLTAGFRF